MDYFRELRIAELITAHMLGTIDDDGRRELERWADECGDNGELFRKLARESVRRRFAEGADEEDIENVIAGIHTRIAANRRNRSRRPLLWAASAAGIAVIAVWLTVFVTPNAQITADILSETVSESGSKVRIILPSGQEIKLDEVSGSVAAGNGVINREGSDLVFTAGETDPQAVSGTSPEPVMTTIVTEQGGELSFRLSDGTMVRLNTDSEFSFPMEFGPDGRNVRLKGEAYFEVSRDPSHPFVVSTGDMDVRVLGTVFNVKSYSDDPHTSATLLSGVIEVDAGGLTKRINPGYTATIDRATGKLAVEKADTFAATAWLHGQLIFNDEGIDAVLRTLARWYDVEFVYDGASGGDYTFSGRVTRQDPLSESLNRITLAGGPVFVSDGDIIYVR